MYLVTFVSLPFIDLQGVSRLCWVWRCTSWWRCLCPCGCHHARAKDWEVPPWDQGNRQPRNCRPLHSSRQPWGLYPCLRILCLQRRLPGGNIKSRRRACRGKSCCLHLGGCRLRRPRCSLPRQDASRWQVVPAQADQRDAGRWKTSSDIPALTFSPQEWSPFVLDATSMNPGQLVLSQSLREYSTSSSPGWCCHSRWPWKNFFQLFPTFPDWRSIGCSGGSRGCRMLGPSCCTLLRTGWDPFRGRRVCAEDADVERTCWRCHHHLVRNNRCDHLWRAHGSSGVPSERSTRDPGTWRCETQWTSLSHW